MDEEGSLSGNTIAFIILLIAIIAGVAYFIYSKDAKVVLINNIKEKLNNLKNKFEQTHPEIAEEIKECLILIANNLSTKAVSAVFKIAENGLKDKLGNGKTEKAYALLDNAKKSNLITQEEYSIAHEVRLLRNKESHELAVKLKQDELKSYQHCYSGAELIEKIYN